MARELIKISFNPIFFLKEKPKKKKKFKIKLKMRNRKK